MTRNEELTASLLTHFRSTVETRVKEVQKRVGPMELSHLDQCW